MNADPALAKLFVEELDKHGPLLEPGGDVDAARRALHSLKGSASLAGFRDLGAALARLEKRVLAGDLDAIAGACALARATRDALVAGRSPPVTPWPAPPEHLVARAVAAEDARYGAEMRDRLERLYGALARSEDDRAAVGAAYREVHAMKGAALAVSDEAMAWFCHGLEERLRERGGDPRAALAEVARYGLVLAELLVAPERAIASLRETVDPPSRAPRSSRAPEPPPDSVASKSDDSLRVPTASLDRLSERMRQIGQARGQLSAGARVVANLAARSRQLRVNLGEALRLIGPPRPWGAPAAAIQRVEGGARALAAFAEQLDEEAAELQETADRVRVEAASAQTELAELRTTRAAWLFERVAAATLADARRLGRELRFFFVGEDTGIDRRVAEQLFDPLLQMARNAVAHGVEAAAERAMRGKPRVGAITLVAERRSGGLRVVVRDDGAGVDVGDVRSRAIARGMISAETARAADDATLLALLFVPGFTTRDSSDLLAGRGVGLDLTLEAVHRLGGTIRLTSSPGTGLAATVDIPFEPGLVRVLWLDAGDATYALPVQQAKRITLLSDASAARRLSDLLAGAARQPAVPDEARPRATSPLVVEVDPLVPGKPMGLVAVDAVGVTEEVTLRSLSPLVRTAGPYAGVVVRGDTLRLCLDGTALAELALAR